MLLPLFAASMMADEVTVPQVDVNAGESADIVINYSTQATNMTGYQMSLYLPEGVTLQKDDEDEYVCTLSARHKKSHSISVNEQADGGLLLICTSSSNKLIAAGSGELLRLTIDAATTASGTLAAELKNIKFSDPSSNTTLLDDVSFDIVVSSEVVKAEQTLALTSLPVMTVGDAGYQLPATTAEGLSLTWTSSNTAVASISSGVLTAKSAGTATITATQAGNDSYLPFERQYTLTVNAAAIEPTGTSLLPQETTVHIGESERMSIHLENETPIIMFEFYMELPEGLHISKDEDDYLDAELNAARADRTHSLVVEQGADGLYHFLCYSSKNKAFTGNDGEILNVSISCDANVEAGVYQGKLRNILMSDQDKNAIELADQPFSIEVVDYILGDVNDDSKINGMDIVEMVTLIMEQSYKKPADLYPVGQPDGVINGMDLVQEVELVMSQSATSNAPAMLAVSAIAPDAQHAVEESNASADKLTVADFTIAPGQTYNMAVGLDNPDNQYIMTEFWMSLPEGVSIATDDYGDFVYEEGDRFDKTHSLTISKEAEGNAYHILIYSSQNKPLKNNTGTLFTLTLQAEAGATLGDYQGRIYNQVFSDVDKNEHNPAEVTFSVTIGEVDTHVVLDELSTSVPTAATNVNVRVMRTINANEWSTICLPFDMTEEQVKTAFGDDVQLKEFMEYEVSDGGNEISVTFDDALLSEDGFMANYPYIIKVSSKIEEFTVDGVTIAPDEDNAVAEYDNGRSGSRRHVFGTFKGTYHAGTTVPNNCLFLSGNKFWYSTGSTNMKAFRGYFDFEDVLEDADGARVLLSFNDETTGIGHNRREAITSNSWYTLDGRKLDKKPTAKGVYVKEGRKVVIK